MELQNSLMLIKADLRRKAEAIRLQLPPSGFAASSTTPGSCGKRGCAAAAAASDAENRPPQKRAFLHALFPTRTPTRKYNTHTVEEKNITPYSRILRSRQQSPPPSPLPTTRSLRGKYWGSKSLSQSACVCVLNLCKKLSNCFELYSMLHFLYTPTFAVPLTCCCYAKYSSYVTASKAVL